MLKSTHFLIAASMIAVSFGTAAQAQQVQEIVVTAQKRAENLQDVPISITAVTSESLRASGVNSVDAITMSTPGIVMTRQSAAVTVYIRGVGTIGGQAGNEGAIAMFVDGVYQPSMSGTTLALNNIDRIEVLKGPQGTLYGRNATGGAINVITRTPSEETAVEADFSYGNYDTVEANTYFTTGLAPGVAIDLAAYYSNQGKGFGTNLTTGSDVNTRRDWAVRSKLLLELGEATRITLSGDYSRSQGSFGIANRIVPPGRSVDGAPFEGGFYDTRGDVDPEVKNDLYGVGGRIEHEFDSVKLTSITAYRRVKSFTHGDLDMTPLPLVEYPLLEKTRQLTQEIQLASDNTDGLQWVVGAFYLDGKGGYDPYILFGGLFAPAYGLRNEVFQKTKSYSLYGQATYPLTDATNLTLGARYTIDKRRLGGTMYQINMDQSLTPLVLLSGRETYKKPTWRIALDHHINDDFMLFGSYSRGFKSGIYNLSNPTDPPVQPETLDAFEIGTKADLFDRRLRFNAAIFYYKYKNMQLNKIENATQRLFNAASAENYGLEVDMTAVLSEYISLNGGFQYVHARYEKFENGPVSIPNPTGGNGAVDCVANPAGCDLSGNTLNNTPTWSGNIGVDIRVPIGEGELTSNINAMYNDGFYWEPDNRIKQNSYVLLNGQIRYTFPGDQVSVRVFGRNLLKEKYFVQLSETAFGDLATAAPARTYGVGFGFKF